MEVAKALLLKILQSVVTRRLFIRLVIYALDKYAEANDNALSKDVVKGVKEALETKPE